MDEKQLKPKGGQYDLNTLASMSVEEFSKFLKEMPYSEDRTGQGFVIGSSLPKNAPKPLKSSSK